MAQGKKPATLVPIGTIQTNTGDQFLVTERFGRGGSGVVYKAESQKDKEIVAVKFYLIPEQASAWGTTIQSFWMVNDADSHVYEKERETLRDLRHPGIQQVLGWGLIDDAKSKISEPSFGIPRGNKVRFLVSRFVDGLPIDKWISQVRRKAEKATEPEKHRFRNQAIHCLIDLLDSLVYLHEKKHYQHSDIRADNIIIHEPSQRPILIDFGFAQAFDEAIVAESPTTRVPPLRLLINAPETLEKEIEGVWDKEKRNIDRNKLRDILFPGLDLYQFGTLVNDLIETHGMGEIISRFDCDALQLLSRDLLNWNSVRKTRTTDVHAQIRKLADGYWAAASNSQIPQLAPGQPIRRIALPGGSFLAPLLVERILETRSFRRLQRLKQLSMLDYVYPGATETRFSHCLAVYSTAVELVTNLVRSPRFTRLFDPTSTSQLLVTALLHDINHFPFLHYFQELEIAKKEQINLFDLFLGSEITGDSPSIAKLLIDAGLDPTSLITLLSTKYTDLKDPRQQVVKSIIDSGVDIDKLSYVQGDAAATGVPFGLGVDRAAILSGADIVCHAGSVEQWHLCFEPRALSAVESLLFARYWNFKQIYWHHTNRALGAMISHVIRRLYESGSMTLNQYVRDTLNGTEFEALAYLDKRYLETFKEPSILRGIESRRTGLFKRLLSIRVPSAQVTHDPDDDRRRRMFEQLKAMSQTDRVLVVNEFAAKLVTVFPTLSVPPVVLVDIPGRPLDDDVRQVYVCRLPLDGMSTSFIQSPFIEILAKEFLDLSRTIRFFIPPNIREHLGKDRIEKARVKLEEQLELSIKGMSKAAYPSTVS